MLIRSLSSLGRFFLQTRILGRRKPLLASFKLTYRCNLTCPACPFHLRADQDADITWGQAIASLDELKRMGCRIVIFEGGEPLLWRDGPHGFDDLCAYARRRFVCVGATTNGTQTLTVATDVLWASLDGIKASHDQLRCGSYDQVMANLRASAHPRLYVHYTMNRENWRDFPLALSHMMTIPQVKGVTVQFFYPYSQGEADLELKRTERAEAIATLIRLKKAGYPILNSRGSLAAMRDNTWRCHEWLLANVEPDGRLSTGCYVRGRGEINCAACGFTPVAEASAAYDLKPGALLAGWRIFLS
jgi:MoaA/NifB/PqqE/SkfB family radical SAM enzyme